MKDPEFNLTFNCSNGTTVALSNGSFVTAISASDGSSVEGESFMLIIFEEAQDISNFKILKSLHPMGAAYNATLVKVGTPTTHKGNFYDVIERNKRDFKSGAIKVKNHFEYDGVVVAKYNPKYAQYLEKEKKRLGENSDEYQMSYCVSPETKILTSDLRWVRADSIRQGDTLVGFEEDVPKRCGQRKFKKTLVEDVGEIERPCYKVTLSDGTLVTCSEEHQWLVFTAGSRTMWKETKHLVSTDRIYKVCDVWNDLPTDYRLGYLSAAFDGEGCLNCDKGQIRQVTFAQRDNVMLEQVKQYLSECGFNWNADYADKRKIALNQDLVYKLFIKGGKRELLKFLGSVRPNRLLNSFDPDHLGTVRCPNGDLGMDIHPSVTSLEYIGVQKVIPIRTSTRTYVAEGLASHNCLKWILERGMFVDILQFEARNVSSSYDLVLFDKYANHVAGIDIGGTNDSTVITMCEVDWRIPVIMESKIDEETGEEIMYNCYNTYLKAWLRIQNMSNHEEQYHLIVDFLSHFKVARVVCDATREASVADRLNANLPCEVIPYVFTSKSKSELYKHFDREITSGRAQIPGGKTTKEDPNYQQYIAEMADLQKGYQGTYMIVSHPPEKGATDDFPDSHSLAVWGCSFEGVVNNTETSDSRALYGKSALKDPYIKSLNKIRAKRR